MTSHGEIIPNNAISMLKIFFFLNVEKSLPKDFVDCWEVNFSGLSQTWLLCRKIEYNKIRPNIFHLSQLLNETWELSRTIIRSINSLWAGWYYPNGILTVINKITF